MIFSISKGNRGTLGNLAYYIDMHVIQWLLKQELPCLKSEVKNGAHDLSWNFSHMAKVSRVIGFRNQQSYNLKYKLNSDRIISLAHDELI